MKKVFLAFLLVLFATAAYAEVKFDMSGDFWGRGSYWWNQDYLAQAAGADKVKYGFYDGALLLYPKITMDNTSINMKIAMREQNWGAVNSNIADHATAVGGNDYTTSTNNNEDNISIERCYLTHKFNENSTLEVGLMDGQVWATSFFDYLVPRYRVLYTQMTPVGLIAGFVEKDAEIGNQFVKNSNKDDHNVYGLAGITKAGSVYIKPLLYYVDNSALVLDQGTGGGKLFSPQLGLNGDLGVVSFEAELDYADYKFKDVSPYEKDAPVWGAYVNFWKALDIGKPGIKLAYGSWNKNTGPLGKAGGGYGFDFLNDFKSNLILGGQGPNKTYAPGVTLGSTAGFVHVSGKYFASASGTSTFETIQESQDLLGFTLIKPYIDNVTTPIKDLTCSASFGYMISNQKDTEWDGTKAYELDLGVAYKITKNLVYSIDAGYAKIKDVKTWTLAVPSGALGGGQPPVDLYQLTKLDNPDAIYMIQHKIEFKF